MTNRAVARVVVIFSLLVGAPGGVMAAGFYIPEQGTAAMGQGEAVVARGEDPSTLFHNPAGISGLEGTQLMIGLTSIRPSTTFTNEGTEVPLATPQAGVTVGEKTDTRDQWFHLPHLYLTHKHPGRVSVGLGITSHFGLGTEWPETWAARYISYDVDLKMLDFNPNVAVELQPGLTVAAGINYIRSTAELKKKVFAFPAPDGDLHLNNADGDGWGYNLGVLFKLNPTNRLGASFRSPVQVEYKGDADFTGAFMPPDTSARTEIRMPPLASFGVANTSLPNLTLEADLQWTGWSTFDSLDVNFTDPAAPDATNAKNWQDVLALRLGGEYRLSDALALRAGYVYDPSPVPGDTVDTLLPDADRQDFSTGLGLKFDNVTLDFAYMLVLFDDRQVNSILNTGTPGVQYRLRGEYETIAHLVGVSTSYRF